MKGLHVSKQITLSLTADDWQLYTLSCSGCNDAAIAMNAAIENAVNQGLTSAETLKKVMPVFRRYEDMGALDSEPLAVLENLLDAIYGERK